MQREDIITLHIQWYAIHHETVSRYRSRARVHTKDMHVIVHYEAVELGLVYTYTHMQYLIIGPESIKHCTDGLLVIANIIGDL